MQFMIKIHKDYDKNKESSYIQYWDINNLYGWAKKVIRKKVMKNIFTKLMFIVLKSFLNFIDLQFLLERMKTEKS